MIELISYAQSFVSFLINSVSQQDVKSIRNIILFGSTARGDSTKESDVDIFIDVVDNENYIENKAKKALGEFYKSIFYEKYWKLLNIENEIKIIVGKLDKWKDLKTSINLDGIILFGKYSSQIKGKNFVLISWEKIRPESKRVWLSKTLYGYNYKKKKYKGLLEVYNGTKISSNCILIPAESYYSILDTFKKKKVTVKTFHVSIIQ